MLDTYSVTSGSSCLTGVNTKISHLIRLDIETPIVNKAMKAMIGLRYSAVYGITKIAGISKNQPALTLLRKQYKAKAIR